MATRHALYNRVNIGADEERNRIPPLRHTHARCLANLSIRRRPDTVDRRSQLVIRPPRQHVTGVDDNGPRDVRHRTKSSAVLLVLNLKAAYFILK